MSKLQLFGNTDIGMRRSSNQDAYVAQRLDESTVLGILCDGMGGVNGGQIASALAISTIVDVIRQEYHPKMTVGAIRTMLMHAVSSGNSAVYLRSKEREGLSGMGTTCDVVLFSDQAAYIAHVGDSRVYLKRQQTLVQATHDHSYVQSLVDSGKITPEEARVHAQKNIITRVVGVDPMVEVDFLVIQHAVNTGILLCSDGLSGPCTDEEILDVLCHTPAKEVCDTLIARANAAGGPDNITVVYLTNEEEEPA